MRVRIESLRSGTAYFDIESDWYCYVLDGVDGKVCYEDVNLVDLSEFCNSHALLKAVCENWFVLDSSYVRDVDVVYNELHTGFEAEYVKKELILGIRDWFDKNGATSKAVIGISGGKDSTIVAGLCTEALGVDRVLGVIMPNDVQSDIDDAVEVCTSLGIEYKVVNIKDAVQSIYGVVNSADLDVSRQCEINVPPRIRTIILRAICQCVNGRMMNTCNYSENYLGYFTIGGDGDGDFAPLHDLTATEVIEVGRLLSNIPRHLVEKTPSDGLCGHSDEDDFGFTYAELDAYLRGSSISPDVQAKIEVRHEANKFKLGEMAKVNLSYIV